jgi:hypothetical protein
MVANEEPIELTPELKKARAREAGLQRAKGLFNLLKNDLPSEEHEALVDGMIFGLTEHLRTEQERRAKIEEEALPKKTYTVWANFPYWCEVEASSSHAAKRIAVESGDWDMCDHKYQPVLLDIYDVQEGDEIEESEDA